MPECPSIECCPDDPYDYRSADAEDSGVGSGGQECPEVSVTANPVSGSYVFFPSRVVLTVDNDNAVIRYTIDGTEPSSSSTLYTAPFEITQAGTMIKARAFITGCSPGPVLTVLYQNPPFPLGMDYSCTTPDNAGAWGVFAGNGTIDNYWQIDFTPASQTEIKRIEIAQLDSTGALTGLKWSTDSVPNPSLDDLHNPVVWLKADAIPGLADGAAVASWPDSSGNGNNAVQATGASRPLYKTNIVNSKPVVRFDGVDDEIIGTMPAGAAKTIIVVVQKRGAIGATSQTAFATGGIQQLHTNSLVTPTGWVYHEVSVVMGGNPLAWSIATLRVESISSVKLYLANALVATADPNDGVAAATGYGLGSNNFAGSFGDYDIAELLIYESALTDAEQADVYDYLNAKYFEAAPTYETWPLVVFESGAQKWSSYQNTLGLYAAGAYTFDLYGDKPFSSDGGFWMMTMILGDDSRITAIKTTNCSNTVNPTACPSPAAPTVTAKCDGAVDVTFANSGAQNYKIYNGAVLAASGTTNANPFTREITGLTPGTLYYFRVELEYAGCGYQSSIPVSAVPLRDPEVTITSDKLTVDPNESFTISWTSAHIGGAVCGGCLDGQVSINQSLGCKAGNAAGSQATSKATPGDYTYEITGCNACGTVTASVMVTVRDVAVCSVQPTIIEFPNPTTFLCAFEAGCLPTCYNAYAGGVGWNGDIPKTSDCVWSACATGGCEHSSGFWIEFCVWCYLSGGVWVLEVGSPGGAANGCIWRGTKAFGNSPLGTYTKTGGCASGPATITIT